MGVVDGSTEQGGTGCRTRGSECELWRAVRELGDSDGGGTRTVRSKHRGQHSDDGKPVCNGDRERAAERTARCVGTGIGRREQDDRDGVAIIDIGTIEDERRRTPRTVGRSVGEQRGRDGDTSCEPGRTIVVRRSRDKHSDDRRGERDGCRAEQCGRRRGVECEQRDADGRIRERGDGVAVVIECSGEDRRGVGREERVDGGCSDGRSVSGGKPDGRSECGCGGGV